MPRIGREKKLLPSRKAWKTFTKTLQSKLHNLNISKTIKTISKSIKTTALRLLPLLSSLPSSFRRRALRPSSATFINGGRGHLQSQAAIYIDEFFAEHFHGETSKGKGKEAVEEKEAFAGENSGVYSMEDAWRAVVASSPLLRVDERAEEFITKFREDMKLQREKSSLDFKEMLARSA